MSDEFTREQAAKYLDVSFHALEKWAHQRRGPSFFIRGRTAHYLKADLDEWRGLWTQYRRMSTGGGQ